MGATVSAQYAFYTFAKRTILLQTCILKVVVGASQTTRIRKVRG